jgi:hypothetical protein
MDAPRPVTFVGKPLELGMAEEICTLLEQTVLKYFPADQPKVSSVPLIPQKSSTQF